MGRLLYAIAVAVVATAGLGLSAPSLEDRTGRPLAPRVATQLEAAGVTGATTLDGAVQRAADEGLDRGLAEARSAGLFATGGAVVVLGLGERALLGVASAPEPGRSRALRAVPAGSVAKPIVAIAAVEAGIDPNERRACPARFSAGGATIRNWREEDGRPITLAEAIAESCNTVFASLAADLWRARDPAARTAIHRGYRSFGFAFPTGLIPGEEIGRVPAESATLGDLMVLAIGQGPLLVTPLQVARAYASIAGEPNAGWVDVNGRPSPRSAPAADEPVLRPVRAGLELAVRTGTARESFDDLDLERLPIAGKTGSAEIGDEIPYAWFAAYAPADRPRYVVAVVVERGRAGAISAAPIGRRVLERLLDLPPKHSSPFPPPYAVALLVPLLAALASPAAGALIGFASGAAVGGLVGGSVPFNGLAFASAGWILGMTVRRTPWLLPVAAGVGSLALPAEGAGALWIVLRAGLTGALAVPFALLAGRLRAPAWKENEPRRGGR